MAIRSLSSRLSISMPALLLCVACSGQRSAAPDDADRPFRQDNGQKSGDRLRARLLVESDSTESPLVAGQLIGWHDLDLGIDCTFVEDTDGVHRCLPVQEAGLHVFSTPTCEAGTDVMAWNSDHDCFAGLVRYLYDPPRCDEPTSGEILRLVGQAPASTAPPRFVRTYFGACDPWEPLMSSEQIFCAVERVDRSIFVTAEAHVDRVGAVRQMVLLGSDGSREIRKLLHPEVEAELYRGSAGGKFLIPDLEYVSSASCSGQAVCGITPRSCARGVTIAADECSPVAYEVGDAVTSCGGESCFQLGRELQRIPYSEKALGEGRIRPLWITQLGEPVAPTGFFFDNALGTTCFPMTATDGGLVCNPGDRNPGEWFDVFSDGCQTRLGRAQRSVCGLPAPRFSGGVRMVSTGPPPEGALFTGIVAGGRVLECQPLAERPEALYEAVPLEEGDLAKLREVVE